ncbi:MAG: hypothetical protein PUF13_05910 [Lachnospiraceae bacterium]|nr:hypothetical protein [Lachnospiraceae bacterium]
MKRCIICGHPNDGKSAVCEICGHPYIDIPDMDRDQAIDMVSSDDKTEPEIVSAEPAEEAAEREAQERTEDPVGHEARKKVGKAAEREMQEETQKAAGCEVRKESEKAIEREVKEEAGKVAGIELQSEISEEEFERNLKLQQNFKEKSLEFPEEISDQNVSLEPEKMSAQDTQNLQLNFEEKVIRDSQKIQKHLEREELQRKQDGGADVKKAAVQTGRNNQRAAEETDGKERINRSMPTGYPQGRVIYGQNDQDVRPRRRAPYDQNAGGVRPQRRSPYDQSAGGARPQERAPYSQNAGGARPQERAPYGQNAGGARPQGRTPYDQNVQGRAPQGRTPYAPAQARPNNGMMRQGGYGQRLMIESRKALHSPLFLLITFLYTAAIAASAVSAVMQNLNFSHILQMLISVDAPGELMTYANKVVELLSRFDSGAVIIVLVSRIPDVFLCLGLWIAYLTSGKRRRKMPGAGFLFARIGLVLKLIAGCVLMLVCLLLAVTFAVSAWVSGIRATEVASVIFLAAMIVLTMIIVMYFFCCLHTVKVCECNMVRGESEGRASAYAAVLTMLASLLSVLVLLYSVVNMEIVGIISAACSMVWMILMGIWMLGYRKVSK